jgi:LmbE family N-acetylglucosaminyl deacetylase
VTRSRVLFSASLPILALALFWLGHLLSSRVPPTPLARFRPLPLAGRQRLLIIAPHCDDETLAAGGTILAAVRQGIDVRVVIVTNGDGYLFATMEEFRRVFPRPVDFIDMGEVRQRESLSALALLGVPADHVTFLGYPDRGTSALWNQHWSAANPYRSPFTETTRSPYPMTYDPHAVYAGEDLLADLESVLRANRPDLVLYPHPDDVHPDHWGVSVFTRLALAVVEREDASYRPAAFAYLVHRPDFPTPRELLPDEPLLPPAPLLDISPNWVHQDLSHADALLKWDAIRRYTSQLGFLRELFQGFVRRDELFAQINPVAMPAVVSGDPSDPSTWRDQAGGTVSPIALDPVRDVVVRDAVASSDLVALYAGRRPDGSLDACLETRGPVDAGLQYALRVTAISEPDHAVQHVALTRGSAGAQAVLNARYVCDHVSPEALGRPWAVFIGGEVHGPQVGILDQIAWTLATLEPAPENTAPSAESTQHLASQH